MELRLPLEMSPGREAACRAVFGTWGFSERCTEKLPLRVDFIHRLEFGDPWTARRSNQSILREISPGCSLEGLMLKLQLQNSGHLMRRADSLEKTDAGRDWGKEKEVTTEDEIAGWHHQLNRREFE